MNQRMREYLIAKREKKTKFCKVILIYVSKLKFNIIEKNIRKKTRNLTQNCA